MIEDKKVEEILAWPKNIHGYHVSPTTGDRVRIGDAVTIGDVVTIGDWVTIGDGVTIGDWVTIGDRVEFQRTPLYIQGRCYFMAYVGNGMIQSGCITETVLWWINNVKACTAKYGYSPDEINEYVEYVELMQKWIIRYEKQNISRRP